VNTVSLYREYSLAVPEARVTRDQSKIVYRHSCLAKNDLWPVKRHYRVRLNSANHQWGKDPPKEVVG
jgi:hypothetical protein